MLTVAPPGTLCLHCRDPRRIVCRGLCFSCYPLHRHQYPRRKAGRRGTGASCCQRCGRAKVHVSGLCEPCYGRYRALYATRQPSPGLPDEDEAAEPTLLPTPTDVMPGPAKVEVLARRVANGERLWNPRDACG